MMKRRRWLWIGGALAGLIIVFVLVGSWLMGEPLRRYVERELNRHLNVWSGEHVYPSPLHLEGQIFDSGRVVIDGHANFLAEPHVALQAQVALERIDLAYVRPILNHYHVTLRQGTVSGAGSIEYAPHAQIVHLQELTLDGVQLDYRPQPQMVAAQRRAATQAAQTAKEVSNKPGILLRADQGRIIRSTFGVVNQATQPPYRLFVVITEGQLTNFSNQLTEGTAVATLHGRFMGSGQMEVKGTFRPETHGPDFNIAIRNEGTQMRSLSDLLRAYANISVAGGLFSLYLEAAVQEGAVQGYVKPFFKDLQIPEPQQAQEKGLAHRLYEELVGGVVKLLENPRREVATQTDISGRLERPQTSTWEAVLGVLQNAFIRAILPGFEREVGQRR